MFYFIFVRVQRLLSLDDPEVAARLMSTFDTQSSGIISALDLICGVILFSQGDIDNKLEGIFLAFDFRERGTIHYDDLVVLLQTCCTALVVMGDSDIPLPDESALESVADRAFAAVSRNDAYHMNGSERCFLLYSPRYYLPYP